MSCHTRLSSPSAPRSWRTSSARAVDRAVAAHPHGARNFRYCRQSGAAREFAPGQAFTCTWPRRRARAIGCPCTGWGGTGWSGALDHVRAWLPLEPCRDCTAPPATPGSATGLFRAPWRVTDRVEIPPDAVSGYYEAKLEIMGGAHAGAVGSVLLIVRQSPAAPASAVLVRRRATGLIVSARLRAPDPRILRVIVRR